MFAAAAFFTLFTPASSSAILAGAATLLILHYLYDTNSSSLSLSFFSTSTSLTPSPSAGSLLPPLPDCCLLLSNIQSPYYSLCSQLIVELHLDSQTGESNLATDTPAFDLLTYYK